MQQLRYFLVVATLLAWPFAASAQDVPQQQLSPLDQEMIAFDTAYGHLTTAYRETHNRLLTALAKAEADLKWLRENYVPKPEQK